MREFRYPQRRLHNLAVTHTYPDGDTNAYTTSADFVEHDGSNGARWRNRCRLH